MTDDDVLFTTNDPRWLKLAARLEKMSDDRFRRIFARIVDDARPFPI